MLAANDAVGPEEVDVSGGPSLVIEGRPWIGDDEKRYQFCHGARPRYGLRVPMTCTVKKLSVGTHIVFRLGNVISNSAR